MKTMKTSLKHFLKIELPLLFTGMFVFIILEIIGEPYPRLKGFLYGIGIAIMFMLGQYSMVKK